MLRPYPFLAARIKKLFESFVSERFDHKRIVTLWVAFVKGREVPLMALAAAHLIEAYEVERLPGAMGQPLQDRPLHDGRLIYLRAAVREGSRMKSVSIQLSSKSRQFASIGPHRLALVLSRWSG